MKKQNIIATVMVLAALALSTPVMAEEGSGKTGATTNPIKARAIELKDKMEEKRDEVMGRKASTTERLKEREVELESRMASSTERREERKIENENRQASSTEKRIVKQQNVAKRQAEQAGKVISATIERLDKIIARLESRIAKIKASGIDTTVAEGFVAEAKTHLSEARKSVEAFASIDLSADKAKDNFAKVRARAAEAKTHIKAAHESLTKAIRSLKGTKVEGHATSTLEIEN